MPPTPSLNERWTGQEHVDYVGVSTAPVIMRERWPDKWSSTSRGG